MADPISAYKGLTPTARRALERNPKFSETDSSDVANSQKRRRLRGDRNHADGPLEA
jgi:hypothetical protein